MNLTEAPPLTDSDAGAHAAASHLSPKGRAALRRLSAVADAVDAEIAEQRRAEENAAWDDRARGVAA